MGQPAKKKTSKKRVPEEIERRWWPNMNKLPEEIRRGLEANAYPSNLITQGYLEDARRSRLRRELVLMATEHFFRTIKTGAGMSRPEDEREITRRYFNRRWKLVACQLTKIRHFIPLGIEKIQFNIYHHDLAGYQQIEKEFKTKKAAKAFVAPEWFGLEVTDNERHGNYSLAKNGKPQEG